MKIVNVIIRLSLQLDICGNNQFFEINSIFILATYTISKDKVYKGFQKYIDASFVFILFFLLEEGYSWSLSSIWGSFLALGLYRGLIEYHWG